MPQNRLKELLLQRSLTPHQLCLETGMSTQTGYSLVKNPDRIPSTKKRLLQRLCSYFEVSPSELITDFEQLSENKRNDCLRGLVQAGLNAWEISCLSWEDLIPHDSGGVRIEILKSKKKKGKDIFVDRHLWEKIQELPRSQTTEAVFLNQKGERLSYPQICEIIRKNYKKPFSCFVEARDACLYSLARSTALNFLEILRLNWEDLTPSDNGGQIKITGGKGKSSWTASINKSLWAQIQELPRSPRTNAVFTNHRGERLSYSQIYRIFRRKTRSN